jgi:hypothetical protein
MRTDRNRESDVSLSAFPTSVYRARDSGEKRAHPARCRYRTIHPTSTLRSPTTSALPSVVIRVRTCRGGVHDWDAALHGGFSPLPGACVGTCQRHTPRQTLGLGTRRFRPGAWRLRGRRWPSVERPRLGDRMRVFVGAQLLVLTGLARLRRSAHGLPRPGTDSAAENAVLLPETNPAIPHGHRTARSTDATSAGRLRFHGAEDIVHRPTKPHRRATRCASMERNASDGASAGPAATAASMMARATAMGATIERVKEAIDMLARYGHGSAHDVPVLTRMAEEAAARVGRLKDDIRELAGPEDPGARTDTSGCPPRTASGCPPTRDTKLPPHQTPDGGDKTTRPVNRTANAPPHARAANEVVGSVKGAACAETPQWKEADRRGRPQRKRVVPACRHEEDEGGAEDNLWSPTDEGRKRRRRHRRPGAETRAADGPETVAMDTPAHGPDRACVGGEQGMTRV